MNGEGVRHRSSWHNEIVRDMPTDAPYTLFAVRDEHWQELFAEMDKKAS